MKQNKNSGCSKIVRSPHPQEAPRRRSSATPHKAAFEDGGEMAVFQQPLNQQLIISGVGGQGILFITRLLAEVAIDKGLPVLTSETHGMAQRGGIVISHLKVGEYSSPLVRPGQADGLLALKGETVALHRHFLKPGAWIVANATPLAVAEADHPLAIMDADARALAMGNPQSVNLMMLGRALAEEGRLFCSVLEVEAAIQRKLAGKKAQLEGALAAFRAGLTAQEGV